MKDIYMATIKNKYQTPSVTLFKKFVLDNSSEISQKNQLRLVLVGFIFVQKIANIIMYCKVDVQLGISIIMITP